MTTTTTTTTTRTMEELEWLLVLPSHAAVQGVLVRGEHRVMTATLLSPRHLLTAWHERGWYNEPRRAGEPLDPRGFFDETSYGAAKDAGDDALVPWGGRRLIEGSRDLALYTLVEPIVRPAYARLSRPGYTAALAAAYRIAGHQHAPISCVASDQLGATQPIRARAYGAILAHGQGTVYTHRVAGDSGSGTFGPADTEWDASEGPEPSPVLIGVATHPGVDLLVEPWAERIAELVAAAGERVTWSDAPGHLADSPAGSPAESPPGALDVYGDRVVSINKLLGFAIRANAGEVSTEDVERAVMYLRSLAGGAGVSR